MAARKLSPKTKSNTTGVPSKRSFSGILPNLPIQFSESLLANTKPESLAEREVLFEGHGLIGQSSSYYFISDKRKLLRETGDMARADASQEAAKDRIVALRVGLLEAGFK